MQHVLFCFISFQNTFRSHSHRFFNSVDFTRGRDDILSWFTGELLDLVQKLFICISRVCVVSKLYVSQKCTRLSKQLMMKFYDCTTESSCHTAVLTKEPEVSDQNSKLYHQISSSKRASTQLTSRDEQTASSGTPPIQDSNSSPLSPPQTKGNPNTHKQTEKQFFPWRWTASSSSSSAIFSLF